MATITSLPLIEKIYSYANVGTNNSPTFPINVPVQGCLILIGIAVNNGALPTTVQVSGNNAKQQVTATDTNGSGDHIAWYTYQNPATGNRNITLTTLNGATGVIIYVISGSALNSSNYVKGSLGTNSTNPATIPIQVAVTGSLVFDLGINSSNNPWQPINDQQIVMNQDVQSAFHAWVISSFKVASRGSQTMTENAGAGSQSCFVAIAVPPAHAPSLWFPDITIRNSNDVAAPNGTWMQVAAPSADTLTTYGTHPALFWENSFFHTVGRIINRLPVQNSPAVLQQNTSQIIIDQVTSNSNWLTNSVTFDHNISSKDCVVLLFVTSDAGATQNVLFNNQQAPRIATITEGTSGSSFIQEIYYIRNPAAGRRTISALGNAAGAFIGVTAISLLGVDKKNVNLIVNTATATTSPMTFNITPTAPNSLILESYVAVYATSTVEVPTANQTLLVSESNPTASSPPQSSMHNIAWRLAPATNQKLTWTSSAGTSFAWAAVVLTPAQAPSFWFPNIDQRNILDINRHEADSATGTPLVFTEGNKSYQLWQNSFLHTIGRAGLTPVAQPFVWQQLVKDANNYPSEYLEKTSVISY